MTESKEQYLFNTYSKLFLEPEARCDPTRNLMCFGFECGDGWYHIIEKALHQLSMLDDETLILQVKEKYGTLRIYLSGFSDEAEKIVNDAENLSSYTCEKCGKVGKLNTDGWYSVRCEECKEE